MRKTRDGFNDSFCKQTYGFHSAPTELQGSARRLRKTWQNPVLHAHRVFSSTRLC